METVTGFISYLIKFCFEWNVPTLDTMLIVPKKSVNIYICAWSMRKCAICNDKAEVHHLDAVGMGRDRNDIVHVGMNAIALCHKAPYTGS